MRGVSGAARAPRSPTCRPPVRAFAALIVCSILANEGLPDIPAGFMPRAAAMVREAGGLVIADEVQAGYARTGHWWGYEVTGFTPDIVVTGKPMGNGLPLAATAASRALVETFRARTRYFNTFASSPPAGGGRHGGAGRDRATRPPRQRRHRRHRAEGRADPAQGRQRRDRRRARPRPVHRRRDGQAGGRPPTPTSPSR